MEQIATLHDVLEDSDVTVEDLRSAGIGEFVIKRVQLLTNTKGDLTTEAYLTRINNDPLARLVKLADIDDNSNEERLALRTRRCRTGCGPSTLVTALHSRTETTGGRRDDPQRDARSCRPPPTC